MGRVSFREDAVGRRRLLIVAAGWIRRTIDLVTGHRGIGIIHGGCLVVTSLKLSEVHTVDMNTEKFTRVRFVYVINTSENRPKLNFETMSESTTPDASDFVSQARMQDT
jgi:hypothetical protein